jgi:LuxR family transcriptional regulator, quorum-sensing system regulator CciR
MGCLKLDFPPVGLNTLLERITIRTMEEIRPAAEALRDAAQSLANFRVAPCANIASNDPMVDGDGNILAADVFGWVEPSERWWERPHLALTSPLTLACRYESEPFWCNEAGLHTQEFNPLLQALDLRDFFERAMTEAAIVIPIHVPFGQIAAVSYQTADPGNGDLTREFEEFGDLLGLLSRKFICSYLKLMDKQQWAPSGALISKREIECLRWAAVGKSDSETALILGRSIATIRFHIQNATLKLNATNRSQAVFKAARLGYLGSAS